MTHELIKREKSGLLLFSRKKFVDDRGSFSEICRNDNSDLTKIKFVQENISTSKKGVLRGLHFQKPPFSQGKLVSCLQGRVFDVALDLRPSSPSYLQHWTYVLKAKEPQNLYIPEGFAHGFLSLEEETILYYKTTKLYTPGSEVTIKWDDPSLGIAWPTEKAILSKKDQNGLSLQEFTCTT